MKQDYTKITQTDIERERTMPKDIPTNSKEFDAMSNDGREWLKKYRPEEYRRFMAYRMNGGR